MMNGSRMKARTSALPLKCRLSSIASHRPSASLKTVVTPVYQKVFHTAVRKMPSFQILTKFLQPDEMARIADARVAQRQHDALEERIGDEQAEQHGGRHEQRQRQPALVLELAQSRDEAVCLPLSSTAVTAMARPAIVLRRPRRLHDA